MRRLGDVRVPGTDWYLDEVLPRALSWLGRAMIVAGVLILGFAAYQLWGTGLSQARSQKDLAAQLAPPGGAADDVAEVAAQLAARADDTSVPVAPAVGEPVGIIEIPALGVQEVVVEGVDGEQLRRGPGRYGGTALPGQVGNVGIAGHRTTYGAPFNRIDELDVGDEVVLTAPHGRFVYRVVAGSVDGRAWYTVDPSEVGVLGDFGDARVTLTACHPKYSDRERIIVHAVLAAPPDGPVEAAAGGPVGGPTEATAGGPVDGPAGGVPDGRAGVPPASLDQGLSGDPGALRATAAFGLGALVATLVAWYVGARWWWRRRAVHTVAGVVVLVLVWCCYVSFDRYLPAL